MTARELRELRRRQGVRVACASRHKRTHELEVLGRVEELLELAEAREQLGPYYGTVWDGAAWVPLSGTG